MKMKVLYMVFVLMVTIFAASCSKDVAVVDNYVDVDISVGVESDYNDLSSSKANDNGYGVDEDKYGLRYTIELWRADGTEVIYRAEEVVSTISQSLVHSFRAVVGDYRLVIFANYVGIDGNSSHYDTSNGLDEITILNEDYTASDASRDCYGYSEDLTISESFSLSNILLKRPMAKMTLGDVTSANVTAGEKVEISYSSSIPNGYDLLNGEVITTSDITPSYPTTVADQIIAYDYIFVADPVSYLMTFKVGDKEVSATINFEQNKITNITATFFSTQTE